jgi:hypothetical protein
LERRLRHRWFAGTSKYFGGCWGRGLDNLTCDGSGRSGRRAHTAGPGGEGGFAAVQPAITAGGYTHVVLCGYCAIPTFDISLSIQDAARGIWFDLSLGRGRLRGSQAARSGRVSSSQTDYAQAKCSWFAGKGLFATFIVGVCCVEQFRCGPPKAPSASFARGSTSACPAKT